MKVAVLLAEGRHPASGRPRRSPLDARALELALRLEGADLSVVHAGDPDSPVLRDYLGMGCATLTVLGISRQADPVPALIAFLRRLAPDLVLTGTRAEGGEDSGLAPYLIAEALGLPIVPGVAALRLAHGHAQVTKALPRGARRVVRCALPMVLAVGEAGPVPRQIACGRARRGVLQVVPVEAVIDEARLAWRDEPARQRPRRLKRAGGGSAAERLRAATEVQPGAGRVVRDVSAADAARIVLDYLEEAGVLEVP